MAKNSLDKLHIELYGNMGEYLGYAKHVSTARDVVVSTKMKAEAKAYAKKETAEKDCERILRITNGGLKPRVV